MATTLWPRNVHSLLIIKFTGMATMMDNALAQSRWTAFTAPQSASEDHEST